MSTNLPSPIIQDSAEATKLFFDQYGLGTLEYNSNDVNATIGFFESKGFEKLAAISTAEVLLKQAKLENIPIFTLLDTLKQLDGLQLSGIVGQILNNNRRATSVLGYRQVDVTKIEVSRQIAA